MPETTPEATLLRNNARQKEFRDKRLEDYRRLRGATAKLIDTIANAAERANCGQHCDNLPDELAEAVEMLTERLRDKRIIICKEPKP